MIMGKFETRSSQHALRLARRDGCDCNSGTPRPQTRTRWHDSSDGRRYRLISTPIHSAKDAQASQDGQNATAGDTIGSVLGALTGGDQSLRSGSVYTVQLTEPSRPIRM